MVRITGSVRDEKPLTSPTGDFLSSVVRRINGKSAKRTSGTASNAPTKTEPSPSSTPRNERLAARSDPDDENLDAVFSESPARSCMHSLNRLNFRTVARHRALFLRRQASDVSDHLRYVLWLDLCTERRHFPSALGDHITKRCFALLLDFVGSQILGVHCLPGRAASTAIGGVA